MKILIIGFGSAGQAHKNNIERIGGFDVKVYDPFVSSLPMLKDLHTFDGFVIASPTGTHLQYLQKLAVYRKPILCEKPIVSDQVPSNRLVELQETNSCIYVAYQMRYLKKLEWLQELVHFEKPMGVYEISVKYGYDIRKWHGPSNPYLDRVGVLLEASHELDYLWWVFDHVSFVNGAIAFREDFGEAECQANLQLLTEFGIAGVHLNYCQPDYERYVKFVGEQGALDVSLNREEIAEARVDMMRDWLQVVEGGEARRLATISDSILLLKLIQNIKKYSKVVL